MGIGAQFQSLQDITSIVSLVFQIAATALIAAMSYIVSRAVRQRLMLYWAAGWTAYTAALLAILFAFRVGAAGLLLIAAYFFLEYAAVLLIFVACRYLATNRAPVRSTWLALVPALVAAIGLTSQAVTSFDWPFAIHSAIVGVGWAVCLIGLVPALRRADAGPGVRIVAVGLALLSLDYLQHLPAVMYALSHHVSLAPYYYTVTGIIDGMLELVLGFGTVVVIIDRVRSDLEEANARLRTAHQRAEEALHTDALSGALTRYSFDTTFGHGAERRASSGSVVVADLDNLKRINDTYGHGAGDVAIRLLADGLRAIVRADDLVYRWGGDEFVVVMVGAPEELARQRMEGLDEQVNRFARTSGERFTELGVSHGVASFATKADIENAIKAADAAMYAVKSARVPRA